MFRFGKSPLYILLTKNCKLTTILTRDLTSSPRDIKLSREIRDLMEKKQFRQVLSIFDKYIRSKPDTLPDTVINQTLRACTELNDLKYGTEIHQSLLSKRTFDPQIVASLIHMYMQCGDLKTGESLFFKAKERTLPMYGALMKGWIKNKKSAEAVKIFKEITNPNEIIYTLFFNACAQCESKENLPLIKSVQSTLSKIHFSNAFLTTSLIDALMKCGDVQSAESVFQTCQHKTTVMTRAMMKGYIKNELPKKAIDSFRSIKEREPISLTLFASACAKLANKDGKDMLEVEYSSMKKSFLSDHRVLTSFVDGFIKCGDIDKGKSLYDGVERKQLPVHTAMMKGLIQDGRPKEAIDIFKRLDHYDEMILTVFFNACAKVGSEEILSLIKNISSKLPQAFFKNQLLTTSLLDAFIRCKDLVSSESLFLKMKKNVINYGHMMNAFLEADQADKSLNLFEEMKQRGIQADSITYCIVVKALSTIGISSIAEPIVDRIPKSFLIDKDIQNALINMWGKIGDVERAQKVFDQVNQPDEVTYSSLINAYGLNGLGAQSLLLFNKMPTHLINEITYVCVLNACSHSGLVDQGRQIFDQVLNKTENIFGAMIDCHSRAYQFNEALRLIEEYETNNKPVYAMYMAILSGARNAKNQELSQKVFDLFKKKFSDSFEPLTSATVLLANTYASSGDVTKATHLRNELNRSGQRKKIGLSWSSIDGKIHRFRAHDRSHPRSDEIYAEIERISKELIEHGHQYDSSWIVRPMQNDETVESVLCGHSERLAIAWNFVEKPNTKKIQITKNLRVCGDCHEATKLLARIRQCEIVVRDANRIHHFSTNGKCSCNDFF